MPNLKKEIPHSPEMDGLTTQLHNASGHSCRRQQHGTVDTYHEIVGVIVWCGVASSWSSTDSAPVTGSQLHKFQKHLSDVPEE